MIPAKKFAVMIVALVIVFSSIFLMVSRDSQATISLGSVRFWAYQIQNQHENNNVQKLIDSHYDMLVIDDTRSLSDQTTYDMASTVARLKSSQNSRGENRKIVIAYIDIGEAEEHRWYWQPDWAVGNPAWIAANDPDNWAGNYPVTFWHPEWKQIIYGNQNAYLDKIITDGFDGVYLDWVEAFSFEVVENAASSVGKNSRDEMIDFVGEIASYARSKKPGFIVIAQNAVELGTSSEYLSIIDAVAQEQVWFDGSADPNEAQGDIPMPENGDFSSQYYIGYLAYFKEAGKPIFTVDYAQQPANVEKAYQWAKDNGFIEYVALRQLDRLTETPPPAY